MNAGGQLPVPDEPPVAGRYELGPVLGAGSSAIVRRGRDLQNGEAVAVKLFRSGASLHDRRQLEQEVVALTELEHPGLIALHDGGAVGDRPFVVTELIDGPSLAERILQGPVPADQVRMLGAQLAEALAHVHAHGFVHRDIKPANVLLEDGQRPRLADFGISRAVEGTAATTEGCVLGTAAYLAPEQVRGEFVGPAADVYALALLLLEALTGRREYPGTPVESATARLFRRPAVPEVLSPSMAALLIAMTADDPAERPTAAEVAAELARRPAVDLVADAGGSTGFRHGGRRHRHRAGVDRPVAALTLLVAAVIAAACTLLIGPLVSPDLPASSLVSKVSLR